MKTINWKRSMFPAVPIPFTKEGEIHLPSMQAYAEHMAQEPITGVALWVHTGRGLMITPEQRELVVKTWQDALDEEKLIVCGVGAEADTNLTEEEYLAQVMEMGQQAKDLGADAILVYPPTYFRGREDLDQKIVEYHQKVAELGLPMILFYLYKEAGGISYSNEVLSQLFQIPEVEAIKMATLDSVCTYQDVSVLVNDHPDVQLLTGEDRMFGYTMTRGAVGALVGLGAASPAIQKEMIDAYLDQDYPKFVDLMYKVDQFAECTFIQPLEGYIERMLYLLFLQGVISEDVVNDPWGPGITVAEKAKIKQVATEIGLI